jgi:hypothetical protein
VEVCPRGHGLKPTVTMSAVPPSLRHVLSETFFEFWKLILYLDGSFNTIRAP